MEQYLTERAEIRTTKEIIYVWNVLNSIDPAKCKNDKQ